jgi:hypothetical protein
MANIHFASFEETGHGVIEKECPIPGLTPFSTVLASAMELDGRGLPFQGLASIQVLNITPANDRVKVRLNLEWGSDFRVRVDLVSWTA